MWKQENKDETSFSLSGSDSPQLAAYKLFLVL
jgi:hypothetical protein